MNISNQTFTLNSIFKNQRTIILFTVIVFFSMLNACKSSKSKYDATGTFEADETMIAAEASGIINQFDITEGQTITAGQTIGYIDSVALYLKKKQVIAQVSATLSSKPDIARQLAAINVQLEAAQKEQQRITRLVKLDAATTKQLDDVNAQVEVIKKQREAQLSALSIASESIAQQVNPLLVQIEQLNDQLSKCAIINPINGTVLTKYVEVNEMAVMGKTLYKVADLSSMLLRAYITGDQFSAIKLNQPVKVLIDDEGGKSKEYAGTIEWISNKAEFTPKTIQTKDERANLVYAIKIKVKNDGFLKIGMYADVNFN